MITKLDVEAPRRGLIEITAEVARLVADSGHDEGLCTVFVQHTSCSLLIQENADLSARRDLERWFDRLAPEGDRLYTHTAEGADDMPAHIKAALTATSLGIPIVAGRLALGTWQGLYLFEHRAHGGVRRLVVHIGP